MSRTVFIRHCIKQHIQKFSLLFLDDTSMGRKDPITSKNSPSSAYQRNTIQMTFFWQTDDGLTLNVGLAALGSGPILPVNSIALCDPGGPCPQSPLDPRMAWLSNTNQKCVGIRFSHFKLLNFNKRESISG